MARISRHPNEEKVEGRIYEIFIDSIKNADYKPDIIYFLDDLFSPAEKVMLSKRVTIALLLLQGGYTYEQIGKRLRVSRGTISKIHTILALQGKGFRKILSKIILKKEMKNILAEILESLTPLPSKGTNWGRWKKERREAEWEREKPF
jgi:uncharacterized protein YerC